MPDQQTRPIYAIYGNGEPVPHAYIDPRKEYSDFLLGWAQSNTDINVRELQVPVVSNVMQYINHQGHGHRTPEEIEAERKKPRKLHCLFDSGLGSCL
ncbi:hypothetical protein JW968_04420 [Candidatus Woesearchaeota archaeon]|nr:hypothetical protein [Candidatus Woesearchaeota archaeon]